MKKLLALSAIVLSLTTFASCDKLDGEKPVNPGDNTFVPIDLTKAELDVAIGANAFAFDVYRALYEEKQMLVSPFSLSLALSMTACGAAGNTAAEMSSTLGFKGFSTEDVASYYNKMVTSLATIDALTTFESANSIWIDKNFSVKKDFLSMTEDYFAAEEKSVSFMDPSTVEAINKWCSDKTHEKIEKMLDGIDPRTVMALINALYFNGRWGVEFNDKTQKEKFTTIDGKEVKVDMMSTEHVLNYSSVDGWSLVGLPYGNGAFQMDVILPPADMPFKEAVESFDSDLWTSLSGRSSACMTNVKMPEFKFEYEVEGLPKVLSALGMKDAFTSAADFSRIADIHDGDSFYIGDVRQKTYIDVNTKGTEAAAVTIVQTFATAIGPGPREADFTADRPFLFLIRERSSNSILFIGQKVK